MKKAWICVLAVFMLVSAFSFAGAAEELTITDNKAVVDLGKVSIAPGSPVNLDVKVAGLEASEPVEFSVKVVGAEGNAVLFSLTSLSTAISGENFDAAKSIILVGNYPVANGFSVAPKGDAVYPVTISGKIVALDASKPVSLNIGLSGFAGATGIDLAEAKAEVAAKNIEGVASKATLAVKSSAVNLDKQYVIKGGAAVIEPTVVPTDAPVTPTDAPVTPTDAPVTPTEAPASPAPVLGLLAGLAAAGLILRRE